MGVEARRSTALAFLQRVVPQGDYYYCTGVLSGKDFRNQVHRSFDTMVDRCLELSAAGYNTYFAMSAYGQDYYQPDPTSPKRKFRTQDNAVAQRALWLDIDCERPGKPYRTVKDALIALGTFLEKTGLPMPLTVCSGQGLHLYWCFTQALPRAEWTYLALKLRDATRAYNFPVDPARTTDAASVLRIPGTLNYRDGQVRPVRVLHQSQDYPVGLLHTCLGAQLPVAPVPHLVTPTPRVAPLPFPGLDIRFDGPRRHVGRILRECAQMRSAGLAPYPAWWAAMSVLKHCVDGERAAHVISAIDCVRYTPEDTALRFSQASESAAGPARCETFDAGNPGVCNQCPYWGKGIGSPLTLGIPEGQAAPIAAPAPAVAADIDTVTIDPAAPAALQLIPYSNQKYAVTPGRGIIWNRRVSVANGEDLDEDDGGGQYTITPTLICTSELYIHSICVDNTQPTTQRTYVLRRRTQGRYDQDIRFAIDAALGTQQFEKWLGNHGILPVHPRYRGNMREFMHTYLAAVQTSLPEIQVYSSFGWHKENDQDIFLVGQNAYSPAGVARVNLDPRCSRMGSREFQRSGDLQTWLRIPEMYRQLGQMEAQLFLCAAFAAPFMRFGTGTATNLVLSLWDTVGGRGKSSLLQAVNSVWGHPTGLMLGANDTIVARYQVLAARKNLPVCMDELTMSEEKQLAALLYDMANGREKRKSLSSGAGLVETGDWNTVTFCTSNRSLYEAMVRHSPQASAPSMRVLEFHCPFQDLAGTVQGSYIEATLQLLKDNFGLAGPAFIQRCFERPEIFKELPLRALEFDRATRQHSDERFWTYGVAMILQAGRLAAEFGLLPFDMDALQKWCEQALVKLRAHIREEFAGPKPSLLTDFLMDSLGETLVVRTCHRTRAFPDTGSLDDPYVALLPRNQLDIRFEQDTLDIYVRRRSLRDWCARRNISTESMLNGLAIMNIWDGVPSVSVSLGRGVARLDRGRTACYKFSGAQLGVALPAALKTEEKSV